MNFIKPITLLTTFFVFLFVPIQVFSHSEQDNDVANAIRLFDNEEFKQAEPIFKKLLNENPEHTMLNYYYGACRTENGHYSLTDLNHLQKANKEKTPGTINYYLGIQYHAREQWVQALKFYNKYKLAASIGEQSRVELAKKIQQCYAQVNPFKVLIDEISEVNPYDTITVQPQSIEVKQNDDSLQSKPAATNEDSVPEVLEEETSQQIDTDASGESIEFMINQEITYFNTTNFRTQKGRELFEKANSKQKELVFSLKRVDELRDEYAQTTNRDEKNEIGNKILSFEQESYKLKDEITSLMFEAKNLENDYWRNISKEEKAVFLANQAKHRAIKIPEDNFEKNQQDTVKVIDADYLLINEENIHLPQEQADQQVIYKIQIGAYSRGLPAYVKRLYKKLSLLRKIENYTDENGVVVYTTGNLTNLEDAQVMQKQVQQEGVKDAFIVPYFNGKRITLERAKEITGE